MKMTEEKVTVFIVNGRKFLDKEKALEHKKTIDELEESILRAINENLLPIIQLTITAECGKKRNDITVNSNCYSFVYRKGEFLSNIIEYNECIKKFTDAHDNVNMNTLQIEVGIPNNSVSSFSTRLNCDNRYR